MKIFISFLDKFIAFYRTFRMIFYFMFLIQCAKKFKILHEEDFVTEILLKVLQSCNGMNLQSMLRILNMFHDGKILPKFYFAFQLKNRLMNFYKLLFSKTNGIQDRINCFNICCRIQIGRIFQIEIVRQYCIHINSTSIRLKSVFLINFFFDSMYHFSRIKLAYFW